MCSRIIKEQSDGYNFVPVTANLRPSSDISQNSRRRALSCKSILDISEVGVRKLWAKKFGTRKLGARKLNSRKLGARKLEAMNLGARRLECRKQKARKL